MSRTRTAAKAKRSAATMKIKSTKKAKQAKQARRSTPAPKRTAKPAAKTSARPATKLAPRIPPRAINHEARIDLVLDIAAKAKVECAVSLGRSRGWSAKITTGNIDAISASTGHSLDIRMLYPDGRQASVSTTDLSESAVRRLALSAIELAKNGDPDPYQGLPSADACGQVPVAGLDDGGAMLDNPQPLLDRLLEAEQLAKQADSRVIGAHRSSASARQSRWLMAQRRSNGSVLRFADTTTSYGISLYVVAEDKGEKQGGYSWTSACKASNLRPAKPIADEALRDAVGYFGWKQAPSGPVRVVFDARTASDLLGLVDDLASGGSVFRHSSCWGDLLKKPVANPLVTVIDDPLIPGGLGSHGCDGEGVKPKKLAIVTKGVLQRFMTGAYSARRLKQPLTGHSSGSTNLLLQPGKHSPQQLLDQLGTGLLVTSTAGSGIDTASGQYSQGAQGFWVEGGRVVHPVQEVTLGGTISGVFNGIVAVGNDPLAETACSSPSLLIEGLTLGGAPANSGA